MPLYEKLVDDPNENVRGCTALILPEIARVIGPEYSINYLHEILFKLMNDTSNEVIWLLM